MPLSDTIGPRLQESLITLLIWDDTHGATVARLLSPEMFDGDYQEIARRVGRYWQQYNRAPAYQADELFDDLADKGETFANLFVHTLQLYQAGINPAFLLDTVHKFVRTRSLEQVAVNVLEQLQARGPDAVDEADAALDAYRRQRVAAASHGLTLFEVDTVLASLSNITREFDTGIEDLDKGYVLPARGELMVLVGVTGTGKSWGLTHLSKRAMARRRKVLYVTCEMSEGAVAARFYQSLLGVSRRPVESTVTRLMLDRDGKFAGFGRDKVESDFSLTDPSANLELTVRIRRMESTFRNLHIRGYAAQDLTVEKLEAAIDEDAATTGFVPDMVVVDYLGEMKLDPNNLRIMLGHTVKALRGLAQRRNLAIATAHQAGRSAKDAGEVDLQHIAEDWTIVGTADIVLTMTQTKLEAELGLMRLYTAKVRNEASHYTVLVTQDYTRGQFAIESKRLPSNYSRMVKEFENAQTREAQRGAESDDADDAEPAVSADAPRRQRRA